MTNFGDGDLPYLRRAIPHDAWRLERGRVVGRGVPRHDKLAETVRKLKVVDKRSALIRAHYRQQFRFCDVVIAQGFQKFKFRWGDMREPQLLRWGHWLRDMKRALDAHRDGDPVPPLLEFPPVPDWFEWNPGLARLAEEIGIER